MEIGDSTEQGTASDGAAKLLPCPFCGAQPELVDYAGWEVTCDCGASFCKLPDRAGCIAGWNRRVDHIAKLSREIRVLKDAHRKALSHQHKQHEAQKRAGREKLIKQLENCGWIIATLRADQGRLDWCEAIAVAHPELEKDGLVPMTRDAIDAAMLQLSGTPMEATKPAQMTNRLFG